MRKLRQLVMASILVAPLLVFSVVGGSADNSGIVAKTTMTQRLALHKSEFKTRLTFLQTARLMLRCKAAQGKVSSLSGRIKGIETSRDAVYTNLVNHLASLQTKLQNKAVDTTELQAEIASLRTQIETFNTDLASYKQTVADLSAMNCSSDPVAFKATLEAARTARQKVATDIKAIRAYVRDTIKPTLVTIRSSLAASSQTGSQE